VPCQQTYAVNDPATKEPALPERIARLLRVVRVLLGHGRHLADTVRDRAAAPGFSAIAACFGTGSLSVIFAHLQRGILRALALERVLLLCAAAGRDLEFAEPRIRNPETAPAPADAGRDQPAGQPARCPAALPPVRRAGRNDPADFHTPTLEQLEREVRRRPLGRTIVDICLDLAVVPGLCTGAFWNELFDLIRSHGGSIATLVLERRRREQAFDLEQDRHPTPGWNRSSPRRETIRDLLGFFIGEQPLAPCAASATGPP
jgi:hypothetical protein